MGILTRLILFFYTIVGGLIAGVFLAICAGVISEEMWLNEARFALNQIETLGICITYFFVSVILFFAVFSRNKTDQKIKRLIVSSATTGNISVEAEAVRILAEKTAAMVQGVRFSEAKIQGGNVTDLRVNLRLMVGTEIPVQEISERVRLAVNEAVSHMLGMECVPVDATVTDMSNAPLGKRQRVS